MDLTSLQAFWKMDEASGSRADAHSTNTLTDTNTVGTATGLVYSLAADCVPANAEYLSIASNAALQLGDVDLTLAVWVYLDSAADDQTVACKGDGSNGEFEIRTGVGLLRFRVFDSAGFGTATDVLSGAFSTAAWTLVVVHHDPAANQIGIQLNNGTIVTASHTTGFFNAGADLAFGAFPAFGLYLDGRLGPVSYWKRQLTTQERTDLYNGGAGLTYAAMVGVVTSTVGKILIAPVGFV